MGSLSNYIENEMLDHILRTSDFTPPTNLYVGLSTADPTDDGSGIAEPSGNGYARVLHNGWDTASARATENTGTISFPEATGAWGTITHFFISTAASGGNMVAHGALSTSKTIVSGDNPSFLDGAIDISFLPGGLSTTTSNAVLDHIFGNTVYDTTASIYVALSTADPGDDAAGLSEPAHASYNRVQHASWDAAAAGATENLGAITFPMATAAWGTITYFALMDASSGGNMLIYAQLDSPRNIATNDVASFVDGALDITMT